MFFLITQCNKDAAKRFEKETKEIGLVRLPSFSPFPPYSSILSQLSAEFSSLFM